MPEVRRTQSREAIFVVQHVGRLNQRIILPDRNMPDISMSDGNMFALIKEEKS